MGASENSRNILTISKLALSNSREVSQLLLEAIASHGGQIRFDQFMDIVMFAPGRGYYDSVNRIFGDEGDFTTAPEISPLFGQCLARQILQLMSSMGQTNILEFGAGSGILAQTILLELEKHNSLPQSYSIYDISPSLRQRQHARLKESIPHLLNRLVWLNDIPDCFNGIIIANEVLDAMPVHKVVFQEGKPHKEIYVTQKTGKLTFAEGPLSSSELQTEMDKIVQTWPDIRNGYKSEINLEVKRWIAQLSKTLQKGMVLLIDYGFTRKEYYQPINHQGNLMCYFQHRAHDDPLLYPGIQDVTCHVDFSLVAETFHHHGLNIGGYTTQGFFLAGCGLESLYQELDTSDEEKFMHETRCLEQLIMPNAMGDIFKVIAITKDIDIELIGFSAMNEQDKL